ncbi:C-X-C chemokine receptor type 2 [Hydra vulgaris]|uniref:C-X-C chemokine receptor type 2 n=1 Tax=Hydra vulgaris TaxID=6087 RepID=A0ABM4BGX2_HYDVU
MLDTSAAVTFLIVLAVAAIFLNSLCIYIIRATKSLKNRPSSMLILNLLMIHLFQGLVVLPLYAAKKFTIKSIFWARFVNNSFRVTYMITFYGTVLGVFCISIDRFLATYWLNLYKPRVTVKRVCIGLFLLWAYIFALCMIPFVPASQSKSNKTFITMYFYKQQEEWVLFMLLFNTALPYCLVVIMYTYIIYRLRVLSDNHTKSGGKILQQNGTLKMRDKDLKRYRQVAYLTVVLTVSYGVFWTPSFIYYPLLSFCKSCFPKKFGGSNLEEHLGFITKYLAFFDAVAAPLIYCFYHADFRRGLMKIKRSLLHTLHPHPSEIPLTTLNEDSSTPEKMYHT